MPVPLNGVLLLASGVCLGFAEVAHPLHGLTANSTPFVWSLECETSFWILCPSYFPLVLAYPTSEKGFTLETDCFHSENGSCFIEVAGGHYVASDSIHQ